LLGTLVQLGAQLIVQEALEQLDRAHPRRKCGCYGSRSGWL
jgi:hypothetical protein